MTMDKEVKKLKKKLGYKGCKNCIHYIEPVRVCEWAAKCGDGRLHWTCPKWIKKGEQE